jgi:hypothetical protein
MRAAAMLEHSLRSASVLLPLCPISLSITITIPVPMRGEVLRKLSRILLELISRAQSRDPASSCHLNPRLDSASTIFAVGERWIDSPLRVLKSLPALGLAHAFGSIVALMLQPLEYRS